ncbi:exfoliative toxin A/B [Caminicella sporogenes DSM 14501]|uniref:Exfoliative toxin A/B n=1 Tax=Caminicella sporogenes DSM 14501 TaxID=1121266 RepID=A0A1M6NNV3_9FIRM|nr:TDT family transporter [Caminicella sporogenes]SHJ97373.1 exfoliative toxin A/B [Caminicella sporogenes DSM 14501]
MKSRIIKKIPLPIAGLMLALAAMGNLILSYGIVYKNIFGILSFVIFILLVLKMGIYRKDIVEDLKNPVIASVFPTFSMGIMILSTYIKPHLPYVAYGIWILALVIHFSLIIYFTKKFIFNFDIKKVFPSYFVVYVGIVVGSVTSSAYDLNYIGRLVFWLGFVAYLILLPLVVYRVFAVKAIQEPVLPTITIFTAPASLCLAGYLSSFESKNMFIIYFLTILSLAMFFLVLLYMPKMLKIKFYPSYSAFTFPFVISAIAVKKLYNFLVNLGQTIVILKYVVVFETLLAVLIVSYVFVRYCIFILSNRQRKRKIEAAL